MSESEKATASVKRARKMAKSRIWETKDVEWIKSDYYCMACGAHDVWQEVGTGSDYYHDCSVRCFACQHEMCCVDYVKD